MLLLGSRSHERILLVEYAYHAGGDLVVDYGLVVLSNNVDTEFLNNL